MIESHASATPRVLLLGGTAEAGRMAAHLAAAGVDAVYAYAGRTTAPRAQPLPMRIGGFGGTEGLAAYLGEGAFTHVIDATHPFAAQISANAVAACALAGVALAALERAAWQPGPGDDWQAVADIPAAVAALPEQPARIFLAIGRQNLTPFAQRPEHHYLLRLVDSPESPLYLPDAHAVIDRGPFTVPGDTALMRNHAITHVVAKNAGGEGASAKLAAARALGLPVIMVARPVLPARHICADPAEVMAWLGHPADPPELDRGV